MREGVPMEIWIEEVHLEKREAVRQRLRCVGHGGHALGHVMQGGQGRAALLTDARELVAEALGAARGKREEEAALRAEALHQRGRRHAGLTGDVREGEVRTEA